MDRNVMSGRIRLIRPAPRDRNAPEGKRTNRLIGTQTIPFILPAALIFVTVGLYPTLRAVVTSLTRYNLTDPDRVRFVGLANYVRLVTDSRFWTALGRSALFVVSSVGLSFTIGFVVALLLARIKRLRGLFQVLFMLPMVVSSTVVAYNFRFMYNYSFGIINHVIETIGLSRIDFLGTTSAALWSTVGIDVWQWTPLVILIMFAGIDTLPKELYEAAAVDGAGPIRAFFALTLPLLRPFIVIVLLIRLMDTMKVYETIYLVTAGGPGTASETLNLYLAKVGFSWFDMGYGSALGFVSLNVTALIAMLVVKRTGVFRSVERVAR